MRGRRAPRPAIVRRIWSRCAAGKSRGGNADPAHQALAGQASWAAFSARWRAGQGLPPLSAEAARRYVTPDLIRGPCGVLLPAALRAAIHRAWCAGLLPAVAAWLGEAPPPPEPGGLWAAAGEVAEVGAEGREE